LAADAYDEARQIVFDRAPAGLVDEAGLDGEQRVALRHLKEAEDHLAEVRRTSLDRPPRGERLQLLPGADVALPS
jgi:hypothetical protein